MSHRRTVAAMIGATLIGLAPSLLEAGVATADDTDTTPPQLSLEPYARLVVGTPISIGYEEPGSTYPFYWNASFTLNWQVTDPSGICAQELIWTGYDLPDEPYQLDPATRSFGFSRESFDFARVPDRWVIRATDCAGNTAVSDDVTISIDTREDTSPTVTYKGRWRQLSTGEFGTVTYHTTRARGASFTAAFPGDGPVALVMDTGPNRGKADVYVDGRYRATLDSHATIDPNDSDGLHHQVVVWQDWYGPGSHTLKVVNRATRRRPVIAFDTLVFRRDG